MYACTYSYTILIHIFHHFHPTISPRHHHCRSRAEATPLLCPSGHAPWLPNAGLITIIVFDEGTMRQAPFLSVSQTSRKKTAKSRESLCKYHPMSGSDCFCCPISAKAGSRWESTFEPYLRNTHDLSAGRTSFEPAFQEMFYSKKSGKTVEN